MRKKALVGLLTFFMAIGPIGLMSAYAQDGIIHNTGVNSGVIEKSVQQVTVTAKSIIAQGKCGENAYWELDSIGQMTISGTGAMWAIASEDSYFSVTGEICPWQEYKSQIKSVVFEKGITNVNDGAFLDCENLIKVTFSDTVTRIGQMAFAKCVNLKDIKLPVKVTTLEWRAFDGCEALEEISIPSTVVYFQNYVFYNCNSLKVAYIEGDSTRSKMEYNFMSTFFQKCNALEKIEVSSEHVYLKSIDGVVYSKDGDNLLDYPNGKKDKVYTIVNGTKNIMINALEYNSYIEKVVIPQSVTYISSGNFDYFTNLRELTIPSTVERVEVLGYGCNALDKITNESECTISIASYQGDVWIDKAGVRVNELPPKSVIYHRAEINNVILTDNMSVQIGKSEKLLFKPVYFVDGYIFADDSDVKFTSSDESILTVDKNGIMTGHKAGKVTITAEPLYNRGNWWGGTVTCEVSVKAASDMESVVVDNVLFTLNDDGTATLKDGRWAPANYTIPEKVTCGGVSYTVTTIGEKAFHNHIGLQSIVMPDSITKIDSSVYAATFYNCINLKKVVFSKNLKEIGKYTFESCTNLTQVTLPEKLEIIDEGGFYKTGITSIKIPTSVKKIGQNAFLGTRLKTFYLPKTVTDFHFLALVDIPTLESITVEKGHCEYESVDGVLYIYGDSGFGLCTYPAARQGDVYELDARTKAMYTGSINGVKLEKLIFPADMTGDYITSLQYAEVESLDVADGAKYLMAKDGVLYTKDGKTLILYPTTKKDKFFFVPSGVEYVRTFVDCLYLEEIYYPATVKKIDGVFYSYAVKKVVFADDIQIESLKDHSFQSCTSLKSICLPRTLKTFSNTWYGNEFFDCYEIEKLYISEGAPFYSEAVWGSQTLSYCDNLTIYGHGNNNKLSELATQFGRTYVDVSSGYSKVLGVGFKDTVISLQAGKSKNIDAVVYPKTSTSKKLTYVSSNTSVAKVSGDGNITAVAPGVCYITATATDGSGEYARCRIEVGPKSDGMYKSTDGIWYYYKNGKIDTTFVGLAKNTYGWWYIKNGKLDTTYTGMAKNQYGWFYVKKGKLDTTYTGLAENEYGQWYMKNGKLDKTANGMIYVKNAWYYFKNGKLDTTYTGLAKNVYGWWYIKNGKLDKTYTGMAKNQYGWWYLKKGTIDFKYTGLGTNAYGSWYLKNGKLDQSYSGKVNINGKSYTIKKGKVVK